MEWISSIVLLMISRLADRTRWPRKWWYPVVTVPEDDIEALNEDHAETSKTVRKTMFTIIGYSLFCLLALGQPDIQLIANNATIKLPFANVDVSYREFLLIGPTILLVLFAYLHIFVGYWVILSRVPKIKRVPFLFNLPFTGARITSAFLLYWLVLLVLLVFSWKTLPHSSGSLMRLVTILVALVIIGLQIRRCPENRREGNNKRWCLGAFLFFAMWLSQYLGTSERYLFTSPIRALNLYKANLSNQDLKGVILNQADLREADLSGADLSGAYLIQTNLIVADLSDANLRRVNLSDANLSDANLRGVDLTWADLRGVDLSGANLSDANLRGVSLSDANLSDANLRGVDLSEIKLRVADLSGSDSTLSEALNLVVGKLCETRTLYQSRMDSVLVERVQTECPDLLTEATAQ